MAYFTLTLWFLLSPFSDKFPLTQICVLIESGLQNVSPGRSPFLGQLVPVELGLPTLARDGQAPREEFLKHVMRDVTHLQNLHTCASPINGAVIHSAVFFCQGAARRSEFWVPLASVLWLGQQKKALAGIQGKERGGEKCGPLV